MWLFSSIKDCACIMCLRLFSSWSAQGKRGRSMFYADHAFHASAAPPLCWPFRQLLTSQVSQTAVFLSAPLSTALSRSHFWSPLTANGHVDTKTPLCGHSAGPGWGPVTTQRGGPIERFGVDRELGIATNTACLSTLMSCLCDNHSCVLVWTVLSQLALISPSVRMSKHSVANHPHVIST